MSTALEVTTAALEPVISAGSSIVRLPPVPWRDPHTVSPAQLAEYIGVLQKACEENPKSPDLRTGGARYSEILLQCQSAGRFFLRRYYSDPAQAGRDQVDLHMTHETLLKLVDDLVATVP